MTPKPIDFSKVEALRRHMLLTQANMASLIGVSRVTYHQWVTKGSVRLRGKNDEAIRKLLKQLLVVMTEHKWPMPEIIAVGAEQRYARLTELLNK
jgi:hypothetical protein